MGLSYEAAAKLFRDGEFLELVRASGRSQNERKALDPRYRVVLANALAFIGELEAAQRLAEMDRHPPLPLVIRSQAESALALVSRRDGDHNSAFRHSRSAAYLAQESNDSERIAWAQLHLFRLLIEVGPIDKILAALPDVRRSVARAGLNQTSAYLHTCVSLLEGRIGQLDEARRHCDIADSLLEHSSNVWLSASSLMNRGSIACLNCEFDKATELFRTARESANRSGHAYLMLAANASIGHVQLLVGQFDTAKESLSAVLRDERIAIHLRLGALEGLARIYLALGHLDEAEQTLRDIRDRATQHERAFSIYHVRWASITKARLLMRRGALDDAMKGLTVTEELLKGVGDIPLAVTVHLVTAQVLARRAAFAEAAKRLVDASELNATGIRELQAQYYYASALILRGLQSPLEQHLRNRAIRLWADQGIVSLRLEMEDQLSPTTESKVGPVPMLRTSSLEPIECVADSLAAICDLAHRPRLLGDEMVSAIRGLKCSSDVKIVESRNGGEVPGRSDDTAVLPLGVDRRKQLTLVCNVPDDPVKAILLADVLRIGRAALELERAREAERNRAAIWPASPAEEHGGVLSLAEDMQALLATARRVAPTTVPVLITGETGTGKEVLARTIHAYSTRAAKSFLPFNCSSVPKDMLDSQLFGHRRGSFTGATENFPGVIRAAGDGTLFLDEIGETTLDVQPKLLRFLDSNEVHPIGEVQPVKADVRVIAATNADLDALVADGRFREDLFYRLNIVRLHVPPLRERRVEIPALANHYLQKHAQEYRKGDLRLAEETMEYLVLYRWPGNVRQLANEMRRMAALAETGAVLMPEHLSPAIAASRRTIPASERVLDPTEVVVRIDQPVPAAVRHLERAMIQHALRASGGRMEEAAARLGLSRKGLYLKRLRYGLEPPGAAAPPGEP
jgi:DNA-binding NtrC family response regulator/tetratricopeptide (TPR) repeat protein